MYREEIRHDLDDAHEAPPLFFVVCLSDYTVVQDGRTLQDSDWHAGFTLGLSNVTVPEISTDVMMSNTELYAHPQASVSELRDADGGPTEAETTRGDGGDGDVGEQLQDSVQDPPIVCEGDLSKPQPDPSQASGQDSPSQEEEGEDEVEMIPPSQEREDVSLNPEDIAFAPTQAMVDHVSQPQEQEEHEPATQEAQVEEMDLTEVSRQEEEPSRVLQRITRRAHHSEGGAIRKDTVARGRGTKSLGVGQDPTEKREQSSGKSLQCYKNISPLSLIDCPFEPKIIFHICILMNIH